MFEIETFNLTKKYPGSEKPALHHANIQCEKGTIFSLLGENGAGKTTTVKILCTVLLPTSGEAYVAGYNTVEEAQKVREIIGYLPQKSHVSIFFDWSIWDNLKFFSAMNNITGLTFKTLAKTLLKEYNIWEKRNELFRNLSGGMQQRVALIRSIIHDPDILFLDEPTSGLDVQARLQTLSMVEALKKQGKTILVTTHQMDVAERLSDSVGIIRSGEILLQTSLKTLKEQYQGKYSLEVFCGSSVTDQIVAFFREFSSVEVLHRCPPRFLIWDGEDIVKEARKKFQTLEFSLRSVSLEDIYLKVYNTVNT